MIAAGPQTAVPEPSVDDTPSAFCCTYCGLPVAGFLPTHVPEEATYCCYGCRIAHAVVQEGGTEGAIRWTVVRLGLAIFFTMNLMAFTMTMWSLDVYDVEPDPFQHKLYEVFRWLSMLLALPVFLLLGVPLLHNAVCSWKNRIISTDLLIVIAVIAAYGTSTFSVVQGSGAIYFEVGAMVLVMMTLGRWIEAAGRHKATEALDQMMALLPDFVTRIRRIGSETLEERVKPSAVEPGDKLHARAGERIAVDGIVVRGRTTVDEQTFSGESRPVVKVRGAPVLAGTLNLDGDIVMRVTAAFRQGSFGRMMQTLQDARESRGHFQRLADRVTTWLLPVVSMLAASCFFWHWSAGLDVAIQTSMSVLLIACPCALGLATPLAVWTALSVAARHQVLFRSGEALERLAGARAICLDKTGTLTTGTPKVSRVIAVDSGLQDASRQAVRSLAELSLHPFSRAISEWFGVHEPKDAASTDELEDTSIRTMPGEGVEAVTLSGDTIRLGNLQYACGDVAPSPQQSGLVAASNVTGRSANVASAAGHDRLPRSSTDGALEKINAGKICDSERWVVRLQSLAFRQNASLVVATCNAVPIMGFLIAESLREDAKDALERLTDESLHVYVLSGDRPDKAESLVADLNVPGLNVEGGLQPHQKVCRVQQVRGRHGITVMVGDGINDAPALAVSDVGIAMGCGADVSRDSADICLLTNEMSRIPWAIELAGRTRRVVLQNLCWAFGYNSVGLVAAAAGWLNPAIAAALMIISSLLVISNSLRLLQINAVKGNMYRGVSTWAL